MSDFKCYSAAATERGTPCAFAHTTRIRRDKSPTDIDTIATAKKLLA